MFLTLAHILTLLEHYKYLILFPVTVIEGPITTVIAGYLVFLGYLHPLTTGVILVAADIVGDVIHYYIGLRARVSPRLRKLAIRMGYNREREVILEEHFQKHPGKTYLFGKIAHGLGGAVLIAAGMAEVDFATFVFWNTIATIPKTTLLLFIGYSVGSSYAKINTYFEYISLIVIVLSVIAFLVYKASQKAAKELLKPEE